jgi:hypothetical protein
MPSRLSAPSSRDQRHLLAVQGALSGLDRARRGAPAAAAMTVVNGRKRRPAGSPTRSAWRTGPQLAFAGLWERWKGSRGRERGRSRTFTFITASPTKRARPSITGIAVILSRQVRATVLQLGDLGLWIGLARPLVVCLHTEREQALAARSSPTDYPPIPAFPGTITQELHRPFWAKRDRRG